jgi:hypothetical protein
VFPKSRNRPLRSASNTPASPSTSFAENFETSWITGGAHQLLRAKSDSGRIAPSLEQADSHSVNFLLVSQFGQNVRANAEYIALLSMLVLPEACPGMQSRFRPAGPRPQDIGHAPHLAIVQVAS